VATLKDSPHHAAERAGGFDDDAPEPLKSVRDVYMAMQDRDTSIDEVMTITAPLTEDEKLHVLRCLKRGGPRRRRAVAAKRTAFVMLAVGACAFAALGLGARARTEAPVNEREQIAALQRDAARLTRLAELQERRQRPADAELLYKQALSIKERAFGPEHVELTSTLTLLADLYASQHLEAKAKPLYRRAYQIQPSEVF
jgi:hypothetical protein